MKIGIDARMMGPGVRGIGRYVERLLAHLNEAAPEHEYVVFTRKEAAHLVPNGMKTIVTEIKWYGFAEQFKLRKIFDAEGLDLLHVPHWNAPLALKTPLAITIHDMILWEHPSLASTTLPPIAYWMKYFFYRLLVAQNARRAKIVFTVSESAKNSILRNLNISPEKIIVTPNGVDPLPNSLRAQILEAKPPKYILSVGSGYPHKNLKTFFGVFKQLAAEDAEIKAVVVGTDPAFSERLKKQAKEIAGSFFERIIFKGIVPDSELNDLYRVAKALVFTSQAEGFGLPVLEAAAAGSPIVASSIDAVREIIADGALLVAPDDQAGFVIACKKIFSDSALKSALVERAAVSATAFRWKKTARLTVAAYNRVFSTR